MTVDGHYVAERFCGGSPICTSTTWKYFVTDNLGSIASITDSAGTVLERDSYDPWGRPRVYATGADDATCGSVPPPIVKRGYTGHEHIESECLVNANARIYDPTVGRFMSPDTTVTEPTDLQDCNPYSYVSNRPMTLTDPSGHFPLGLPSVGGGPFTYSITNESLVDPDQAISGSLPAGATELGDAYILGPIGDEPTDNGPETGPGPRYHRLDSQTHNTRVAATDTEPEPDAKEDNALRDSFNKIVEKDDDKIKEAEQLAYARAIFSRGPGHDTLDPRLTIGRYEDLLKPDALRPNEVRIYWPDGRVACSSI